MELTNKGKPNAPKTANTLFKPRLSTIRGRVTKENTCAWVCVDATALKHAVAVVQANGGAMLLGATRDGSALVITVLLGNEKESFYGKDAADTNDILNDLATSLAQDILPEVAKDIIDKLKQYS